MSALDATDLDESVTEKSLLLYHTATTIIQQTQMPPAQTQVFDLGHSKKLEMTNEAGSQTTASIVDLENPKVLNDIATIDSASASEKRQPSEKPTDGDKRDDDENAVVDGSKTEEEANVNIEDSLSTISSNQGDMCRICHCVAEDSETLISPCDCCGSMKWVHQKCLQKWVKSRDAKKCELCGFSFNMTSSVKPFRKWSKLNMSSVERRRVLCSVTFHIVAITCVIWSLYVLIDRTTQEIQQGNLNWPFWTKLVVVAIGFTGGLVFMYVQCKTYVKLFRRWKQFNRVIYINDIEIAEGENSDNTDETALDVAEQQNSDGVVVIQSDVNASENPVSQ